MIDLLAQFPGYALRRAANAAMSELGDVLADMGFKITEAAVLLLVRGSSDQTSSMIGKTLDIQRANMVPLLNRLETAGWISRRPIDGKSMAIVLTPAGEKQVAALSVVVETFERELLQRVPAEHRDHLLPALNAIWR